jgi:hypothetical protein
VAGRGARAASDDAGDRVLGEQLAASGGHSSPPFLQSLSKTGFTDGRNVAIEYRWASEDYDRLPAWRWNLLVVP